MAQLIKKGWDQELMISTAAQEDAGVYDAGVAVVDNTTHTAAKGFLQEREWNDGIATDKEEVTGTEHGTDQEITEKRTGGTLGFPKGLAHWIGFYGAAVLGAVTVTPDGGPSAYRHAITPVVEGTSLKSWQLFHKIGGQQYKYTGCKGNSLKISGEEEGYILAELGWMGSGTRAKDTESLVAVPSSSWTPINLADVFMESGANISITAQASWAQGAENISSATPETLNKRVKSFEFIFNNNLEPIAGSGGDGTLQDLEYQRRTIELKLTMRFKDQTELDHYLAQDALALEVNVTGASIGDATYNEGFILVIPRFKLKAPPLDGGDPNATLEIELDADVQDDGTNKAFQLNVYNTTAAYLA
jgi:hypothetical protein